MKNFYLLWFNVLLVVCFSGQVFADGPIDQRKPAAITAQDVPVIPEAMFKRMAQYHNTRSASFRGWDPSGGGMVISTRFGNARQIHYLKSPGARREQLTFSEEPTSGFFIPGVQDGSMLLSRNEGGAENYQIYFFDRQQGKITRLTDGKSRNQIGTVRKDGQQMIVISNKRNGKDRDIYLMDPRVAGKMELLKKGDTGAWDAEDWSKDGRYVLFTKYVSINESYLGIFDMKMRTFARIPMAKKQKVAIGSVAFSPDAKSIYLTTDLFGEFRQLVRYDIAKKTFTILTKEIPWSVSSLEIDRKTGKIAFTTNEDGMSKIYLIEQGKLRKLKTPVGIIYGLEFSPDGSKLGFTFSRPNAPSDVYSLALTPDAKLIRWTFSEVGGLNPHHFVLPELIRYKSFDGLKIPAYVFKPNKRKLGEKLPVVIRIHGGPESQFRPYFSSTTQYYVNELGAAVICPNVRGSSGYGKTYVLMDNGMNREKSVKDIGALLDWIKANPQLDENRVIVQGRSYGGYMVLASLTHYSDRLKGGIDVVGIASFITFLERTAAYRRDLRRAEYGDERIPEMRAFFNKIDPLANAHKIKTALLVAHGKNDPRVPFFEAQQIARKVRAHGRKVWTVYADNEGHSFRRKDNYDYLRAVEALFIKKNFEQKN